MTNVFTIPADVSFVDALAAGLWNDADGDPMRLAEMLVLLPTRRACRNLREAFLRVSGGKASLLPRMQPLGDMDEGEMYFAASSGGGDLIADIPPAMPPLRRRLLLARLVMAKDGGQSPDQALRLAEALGDLLDQVHTERGNFANLAGLVPDNLAEHWQETLKFLEIVTAIWPRALEEEGCVDAAARRNLVLEAQTALWREQPPRFPVIAAGSTASIPAVAELLAVIALMPSGRVVLPGLDTVMDEEAWQSVDESHPQYGMKKWLEDSAGLRRSDVALWEGEGTAVADSPRLRLLREAMRPPEVTDGWRDLSAERIGSDAITGLSVVEAENTLEEAEAVALRIRAVIAEEGRTAMLVTPDRALAGRVAAALRRWDIDADDSGGAALSVMPLGGFLTAALRVADPCASAIDCLTLLKHPLAGCGLAPPECRFLARVAELRAWRGVRLAGGWQGVAAALVKKANAMLASGKNGDTEAAAVAATTEAEEIEKAARFARLMAEWTSPLAADWSRPMKLRERLDLHIRLAEKLASTDTADGAARLWRGAEGDSAASWIDDLRHASDGFPELDGRQYERVFACLLSGVVSRPTWGRHPRVEILGPLEARLRHADAMILSGLNEGTWPPEPAVDPWMSRPMKRDFGLSSPERRAGLSAHDFVQFAAAKDVTITRSRRTGSTLTVPSRLLARTEIVLSALGHGKTVAEAGRVWLDMARALDEPEKVSPCDPPCPRPPLPSRPRRLNVTEIGLLRRNPYAIYAKRVLRLKPLEDIDADIDAADRGNIVHAALEKFVRAVNDAWPKDPLSILLEAGREEFARFSDRPQVKAFWWPRFEAMAEWLIKEEEKRRAAGGRILAAEAKGSLALPFADGTLVLEGRADRVDAMPDGGLEIIDYKTGSIPSGKDVAEGWEPQLPLLAIMAEDGAFGGIDAKRVSGLGYWNISGGNGAKIKKITAPRRKKEKTSAGNNDEYIDELIKEERARLSELLQSFALPETPYEDTPDPRHAPRHNDYRHLSRTDEWEG